jgi:pimeloyl-ACP methyl ester carboxylesterase
VTAQTITTERITTRVLFSGADDGVPVLFLHGNASSATWWEETMVALPEGFRGIAPDQRGYGEADAEKKIDATRGTGDLVDDVWALLDHLKVEKAHVVGNSMGGYVIWRMLMEQPQRFLTVTLVAPGSPFGFGATKGVDGTPCNDDYAGSGAGIINAQFVQAVAAGDRSADTPFSPRNVMKGLWNPAYKPAREEELLSGMLAMHIGEQDYPGDAVATTSWPMVAPGQWGANNALSPKYAVDIDRLYGIYPKPRILWLRGSDDKLVADGSLADMGTLGAMGLVPGWPGADVYPPQPMISQTRAALEKYKAAGGDYEELIIQDAAHVPFLEKPDEFNQHFHAHIMA